MSGTSTPSRTDPARTSEAVLHLLTVFLGDVATAAVWRLLQGPFIASCSLSRSTSPAPPLPPSLERCLERRRRSRAGTASGEPAPQSQRGSPPTMKKHPSGDEEDSASPELPHGGERAADRGVPRIQRPSVSRKRSSTSCLSPDLRDHTLSRPAKPSPWLSERVRKACAVGAASFRRNSQRHLDARPRRWAHAVDDPSDRAPHARVLLVDDEEAARASLERGLRLECFAAVNPGARRRGGARPGGRRSSRTT